MAKAVLFCYARAAAEGLDMSPGWTNSEHVPLFDFTSVLRKVPKISLLVTTRKTFDALRQGIV